MSLVEVNGLPAASSNASTSSLLSSSSSSLVSFSEDRSVRQPPEVDDEHGDERDEHPDVVRRMELDLLELVRDEIATMKRDGQRPESEPLPQQQSQLGDTFEQAHNQQQQEQQSPSRRLPPPLPQRRGASERVPSSSGGVRLAMQRQLSHNVPPTTGNHNRREAVRLSSSSYRKFPRACWAWLQRLPGNDRCMDCGAYHPQWAAVSYGALLCLQCSGHHRSLGVNVSRVRSIHMDEWSPTQILTMMEGGNEQLGQFFQRHCLCTQSVQACAAAATPASSSTTTAASASTRVLNPSNVTQLRYKTKAALFYRQQMSLHIERLWQSDAPYVGRPLPLTTTTSSSSSSSSSGEETTTSAVCSKRSTSSSSPKSPSGRRQQQQQMHHLRHSLERRNTVE